MKKSDRDETAKSFIPQDDEVELLKFMKEQEKLLIEEEKKNKENGNVYEEVKDDDMDADTEMKLHQGAED